MTLQSASPWSLLAPKLGWKERTGPHAFKIVFSHEEIREADARFARDREPARDAYIRAANEWLARHYGA